MGLSFPCWPSSTTRACSPPGRMAKIEHNVSTSHKALIDQAINQVRSACSQRYEVPDARLEFDEQSFSLSDPTAWNLLPVSLFN